MEKGKVVAYVYTSSARIPIADADVIVSVTDEEGKREIRGARVTNADGKTEPIEIDAPDMIKSESPGNGEAVFAVCDIKIMHVNYETVIVEDVQVFANTTTVQNVEMIPIRENATQQEYVERFKVTPQNL